MSLPVARLGGVLLAVAGCGARLPVPPETDHRADAPVPVPYPPPPARVEVIEPAPDESARWVDGSWQFDGQRYTWTPGGWQRPRAGQAYAPPVVVRRADGQLVYFPGRWLPVDEQGVQP